jgi:hypothetical protein
MARTLPEAGRETASSGHMEVVVSGAFGRVYKDLTPKVFLVCKLKREFLYLGSCTYL